MRAGLCGEAGRGRRYAFAFQDLVVLYAARDLMNQNVPAARVRRALAKLLSELPGDRPLSGLRIFAAGGQVTVRDGATAWHPETGQTVLDFGLDELTHRVSDLLETGAAPDPEEPAALRTVTPPSERLAQAQLEFQRAIDREDSDIPGARAAYQRALELDPDLVDAYVNLGRIVHETGEPSAAALLYRAALERSPEDPIVHFNLALALEDTDGATAAAQQYERALTIDADFADAHYNLAGLCEQLGRQTDAIRHYHAYKRLTEE